MKIFNVIENTRVEGPGLRTAIWFQGCKANCPGCFNKQAQALHGGHEMSVDDIINILAANDKITGVTIAGGEPMLQPEALKNLLIHIRYRVPHLNTILYTGIEFGKLVRDKALANICVLCDVVIAGPFVKSQSPDPRRWVGSRNQEILYISDRLEDELDPWPVEDHKSEIIISDTEINICGNEVKLDSSEPEICNSKAPSLRL